MRLSPLSGVRGPVLSVMARVECRMDSMEMCFCTPGALLALARSHAVLVGVRVLFGDKEGIDKEGVGVS